MVGMPRVSSPVPTKNPPCRGQRCTLNLSRAEMSSRLSVVNSGRGGCQLRCRPRHLTIFRKLRGPSLNPSCMKQSDDVNIHCLATDLVILNQWGQVARMTLWASLTYTADLQCAGVELMTRQLRVRYFDHLGYRRLTMWLKTACYE
ncbi:hypothetical protein TNCV_700241 [Trichonephila clavipes]|nr:hypothetical protein TNCV_700241 [Trichonephila clavipes]